MKTYLKEKAIKLRNEGNSYNLIVEKLKISKSTLSSWLKDLPFSPSAKVLARIQSGPMKSGRLQHAKRVKNIADIKQEAKKEIGKTTQRDLWMLGLGVYLGEGSKSYEIIRVINSDPEIVKLAIKWFKEACGLGNKNITVAIHLYPDNDIEQSLLFWSKHIKIPLSQFRKTQIDKRQDKKGKKKKKLPHGTAHVTIVSNGDPNFGVSLHRRIMGWAEAVLGQV